MMIYKPEGHIFFEKIGDSFIFTEKKGFFTDKTIIIEEFEPNKYIISVGLSVFEKTDVPGEYK